MCGIVGVLAPEPVEQVLVERMRDRLAHRGPDHAGIWRSGDGQVCLGHRRLAIVDLSPEANQPFHSHDGRFTVTFNGEIYNFRALREELAGQGVRFRTRSDTEVLVEAYRRWGARCPDRLSGMFAFAVWDARERRLFCARDRAGEKPFYYTEAGGCFLFASELKALAAWPAFRREIHYPALIDFLTLGFVADPKSIWEGTRKLPPGCSMTVALPPGAAPRVPEPTAYWDLTFRPDEAVADWSEQVLATLEAASTEMAFADVPVGTFLSGGVDSSSVTAALSRAGYPVQSFTVGFEEQDYDERPWARLVAERYAVPFVERVVAPDDVDAVFDAILWHYDEPFNDYSYLPTYYLCREARKDITVALSGDGGDELFAGYLKYQRLGRMQGYERFLPRPVGRLVAAGAGLLLPETSALRRTAYQYGQDATTTLADMLMWVFTDAALRESARGPLAEALAHYTPVDTVRGLLQNAPPAEVGLVNAMRYLDFKLTLAGDILVKVDRASMAVSLEVRPVYLHRDVIALAERVPAHRLAGKAHSKEVLKHALRAWLPEPLLYRKKQGFAMPLQGWIRERGSLNGHHDGEDPLADVLDVARLNRMTDAHAAGRNLTSRIHSLYFLRRWLAEWT
ncbi:MAG: asparagine synthase (glutamine-hydrolyzing) [Rhodothermales bacterium]|nr:asparagine synthase (glutamine-hydrolyzing) [Rhodothermales bacterium]